MKYLVAPFAGLGWSEQSSQPCVGMGVGEGAQLELPKLGALISLLQPTAREGLQPQLRLRKCSRKEGGEAQPGHDLLAGSVPRRDRDCLRRAGCQALQNLYLQPTGEHEAGVPTATESAPSLHPSTPPLGPDAIRRGLAWHGKLNQDVQV